MPDEAHKEPHGARRDAEEPLHREDAADEIDELLRRLEELQADADKRLRALARERPFLMLGAALALGFLVGRAMRRL